MYANVTTTMHRSLASSERAGTFARRKARTLQRDYLRRAWRVLLPLYLGLVTCVAWPALFFGPEFVRGLVVGLAVAGSAGAIVALVIIQTGTGPTMAGELAEQWTVHELHDLLQLGYQLVNHIDVDGHGDADHVLIGPAGLFVLESKWSAAPLTASQFWTQAHIAKLERRTRATWLQLKRHGVPRATPVVVLWDEAARQLKAGTGVSRSGSSYVVARTHLRNWLLARAPGQLEPTTVANAHEHLCQLAVRTDAHEAPVPASVEQLTTRALLCIGTASGAFVLPWVAATWLHPLALLLAPVLLVAGLATRRHSTGYRATGLATATGAAATCMLAFGAALIDLVHRV